MGMSDVVPFPPPRESPSVASVDPRDGKLIDAIKLLLSTLPRDEQLRVLQELTREVQPISAPRAGGVLGTIVRWIPPKRQWTVEDAKRGVAEQGVSASPKEVHNAIAYLTRKRRIRRISYGLYMVDDEAVVTSDNLGGGPPPMEDGEI